MAIHSKTNLYPGVNAHLNSYLQEEGADWESFHASHIEHVREALESILPPNYYAVGERSLQVRGEGFDIEVVSRTTPDVTIYQEKLTTQRALAPEAATPTRTLPLWDLMVAEDDYFTGIVIHHVEENRLPGRPVTRIELLSTSNKPPRSHYAQYTMKRFETLRSGIALVEIDYLHESQPVWRRLPSYLRGDVGAFPYMVVTSDPRSAYEEGKGVSQWYGFAVDHPMPRVAIPLVNGETVTLDLGSVYSPTFESSRLYTLVVDYALDPPNFDRYHAQDQTKIRALLAKVRAEHTAT
ncbi:MAG: DUF4058 family protein [Anaerolineae bacterium]|nr:DUF4058 family protein [Anaerolineae bacterium]